MYGSIHTHFESRFDTANDLKKMVQNFIDLGAKKVAVTEHGVFSSYEDLRDTVSKIKKKAKENDNPVPDFDIIPGIEAYFEDNAAHLILIAKNYQGYLDLCKIITESNSNMAKGENEEGKKKTSSKPIVTKEILEKYVTKGDLICTSACIGGPFGHLFGLDVINAEDKIKAYTEEINSEKYNEIREKLKIINDYETVKAQYQEIKPTKARMKAAKAIYKATGDDKELTECLDNEEKATLLNNFLDNNKPAYENAVAYCKQKKISQLKKEYNSTRTRLTKKQTELEELKELERTGKNLKTANELFDFFINTFGSEDFYFELQNHGLDKEKSIYNNIIDFANTRKFSNFIASNDIHIGLTKQSSEYDTAIIRRNVIQYTRNNVYYPMQADDKEYVIKDDDELRGELLKIYPENIVDIAMNNIEKSLSECNVTFPKTQNHYPKFCADENAEFERKVREGIALKFPNGFPDSSYKERLEYELNVIKTMGYAGYHLIVADYLEYGRLLGYLPDSEIDNAPLDKEELKKLIKDRGYPMIGYNIGPGRGSAVGSLCCYLLGITDIDPMPYNLLFERFLNIERVSMPKQYWVFSVNAITQRCVA